MQNKVAPCHRGLEKRHWGVHLQKCSVDNESEETCRKLSVCDRPPEDTRSQEVTALWFWYLKCSLVFDLFFFFFLPGTWRNKLSSRSEGWKKKKKEWWIDRGDLWGEDTDSYSRCFFSAKFQHVTNSHEEHFFNRRFNLEALCLE